MTNNDVLRSLRYILNISDSKLIEIIGLANYEVNLDDITAYLKREDEKGYKECSHKVMAHFLNGLVIFKRGTDETRPPQPIVIPITNNIVLKKLRVAFELKERDIISIIEKNGLQFSKNEFSAFLRKEGHRNYRDCGDQFLRTLLKGLANEPT
jgi:uncharacterized protein YehS (DUF1456 family)